MAIPPYSEVFNTYGEDMTNAQLLAEYGFALDGNDNDCITWDWEDLCECTRRSQSRDWDAFMEVYAGVVKGWGEEPTLWEDSGLVYCPSLTGCASPGRHLPERGGRGGVLCLDSDGRISHQLWIYCALSGMDWRSSSAIEEGLRAMAGLQLTLEGGGNNSSREVVGRPDMAEAVGRMAHTAWYLCDSRRKEIGGRDLAGLEVLDALDVSGSWLIERRQNDVT